MATTTNTLNSPIDSTRHENYIMSLFPRGKPLAQILDEESTRAGTKDLVIVEDYVNDYIQTMNQKYNCFLIDIDTITVKGQKHKVKFLKLTPEGIKIAWSHIDKLKKENLIEYLKWIKVWSKFGDDKSKQLYTAYLHDYVDLHLDICDSMRMPQRIEYILREAGMTRGYTLDNSNPKFQQFVQYIMDTINRGIMMGLLVKSDIPPKMDDKNNVIEDGYDLIQLSEDGLRGVMLRHNELLQQKKTEKSTLPLTKGTITPMILFFGVLLILAIILTIIAYYDPIAFGLSHELNVFKYSKENDVDTYTSYTVPSQAIPFIQGIWTILGIFMAIVCIGFIAKRKLPALIKKFKK